MRRGCVLLVLAIGWSAGWDSIGWDSAGGVCWAQAGEGPAPAAGAALRDLATEFPFRGDERPRGAVDSPWRFFGFEAGARFTPHEELARYCRHVAEHSDRVLRLPYGRSAEGRELSTLFISAPEHLARLDEIRALQGLLADPRRSSDGPPLEALLASLPAVVWLSYTIHGNEASGSEAALQVVHHLADDNGPTTRELLSRLLIIIDPVLNPDGRERYRSWYHAVAAPGGDPDPQAREHHEPWPGGRTNRYYFDLNRDWAWQSQPETRARAALYLAWQPLVHADLHEMSPEENYFFFPAATPSHAHLPAHTHEWGERFGRANAAAFDARGWPYFTAEAFDLFYPGYGDTWPSFQGAIGMTYEQGGGPRGGLVYRRQNGELLTLRERLHHHTIASLATLACAAEHKQALQRSFHEFRRGPDASDEDPPLVEYVLGVAFAGGSGTGGPGEGAAAGPAAASGEEAGGAAGNGAGGAAGDGAGDAAMAPPGFAAGDDEDPEPCGVLDCDRARALVELLLAQGIEVEVTMAAVTAEGLRTADGVLDESVILPAGTVLVPVHQPVGRLARALLEPRAHATEQRFYDISAWSLPFAMGVPCLEAPRRLAVERRRLEVLPPRTAPLPPVARVAYLLPWDGSSSARALRALQQAGLRVGLVGEPLTIAGESFPRGTLVVRRGADPDAAHAIVCRVAQQYGVAFTAVDTSWTEHGIDLGSGQIRELRPARIAVLSGPGIASASFGAIWYLLEQDLGIEFTAVDLARLGRLRLSSYDVLVLPEGDGVRGALVSEVLDRLRAWVEEGGVLVALGESALLLGQEGVDLVAVSTEERKPGASGQRAHGAGAGMGADAADDGSPTDSASATGAPDESTRTRQGEDAHAEADGDTDEPRRRTIEELRRIELTEHVPGNIFRVELDPDHALAFGVGEPLHVFMDSTANFALTGTASDVAVFTDEPAVSGHISADNVEKLRRRVYLHCATPERGAIVLFAGDPNFRLFWRGTTPLFVNALLLLSTH